MSSPNLRSTPTLPAHPFAFDSRRGHAIAFREATPADSPALAAFLTSLSTRTIYLRYFTGRQSFSPIQAQAEADTLIHNASHRLLLLAFDTEAHAVVGVAELVRGQENTTHGEIALTITDRYQGEGIGRALCATLFATAAQQGIEHIGATIMAENRVVLRMLAGLSLPYTLERTWGEVRLDIAIGSKDRRTGRYTDTSGLV